MEPSLENNLVKSEWITSKCKTSDIYAQNLYAGLCNNTFLYENHEWSCSWRYAGGIVAEIVGDNGDYTDYYCSGAGSSTAGFVPEGFVTEEIALDLIRLGWIVKS